MPSVLEGTWNQGQLLLWAHDNAAPADAAAVRALLGEVCGEGLIASAASAVRTPDNLGGAPANADALALLPAEAIDVLISLPQPGHPSIGPSLRQWASLARLVCDLISAGQFVPRIIESESGLFASWRVIVTDRAQLQWLEQFAALLPAEGDNSMDASARRVEEFLASTTDALVRRTVSDDSFIQGVHERAASPDAAPEVRWLSSLLGVDRALAIDDFNRQAAFLEQARAWLSQLDETAGSAMRLTFILHEPPEPADDLPDAQPDSPPADEWTITLHLESLDGDGQLIDAHSLWESAHEHAPILGRHVAHRRSALLAELSRAAEVFAPAQALLTHPAPASITLATTDAHAFIRHWAPILRDRGFGVVLPQWSLLPDEVIGLDLLLEPSREPEDNRDFLPVGDGKSGIAAGMELSSGQMGLDSLMQFNWRIAIGDQRLSADQFETLVSHAKPLVRFQGKWINLDLEAARKAVEFLKKGATGKMSLVDAFRTAFTASRASTGLNVVGLTGRDWVQRLLEQAPLHQIDDAPQPKSFIGTLRPYQLRGLHWLAFLDRLGLGACLADDMGLGKTIQLIALMLKEREDRASDVAARGVQSSAAPDTTIDPLPIPQNSATGTPLPPLGPTLLFAPTSVVGNWLREVQRFAPQLNVMVHHGAERLSGEAFAAKVAQTDLVITSYSLAHRDRDELSKIHWRRLALDEAQKIKNPAAAATLAIRSLIAPRRVALTGTPIENHLSELWSIMQVLNPDFLGTAAEFRERFAVPIEKLGEKERAEQLRRMIRPFVLRRTKADPLIAGDLPEKLEMKVFCNLTSQQAAIYQRLVGDSLRQIDSATGMRRRGLILATLTRLKQVCNHPALLEKDSQSLDQRSGKCERLIEMLEEMLEEGDAALVFTQFREMGHLLERMIKSRLGVEPIFLHGGTPAKMRDVLIQRFQTQEGGGPRIFLLSLRAGGLGLNLTAANHVFHFDRWWNPAVEQQATDRAHRVGQTRKVQVHKFVCIGTMEERIDRLLSEKQALADQIVGSGDEWLTEFSTEQLRQYLALSQEAVGEFE